VQDLHWIEYSLKVCHEKEKGFRRKIDVPETQIKALNCDHRFDAVTLSAEVVAKKPNLSIFLKASDLPE
ncbi:hypothetical protein MKW98_001299, partial [Papaver atlanticum]